jgi:hypothetical protein
MLHGSLFRYLSDGAWNVNAPVFMSRGPELEWPPLWRPLGFKYGFNSILPEDPGPSPKLRFPCGGALTLLDVLFPGDVLAKALELLPEYVHLHVTVHFCSAQNNRVFLQSKAVIIHITIKTLSCEFH